MAKIAPQLPIEVDSETGVWTSDALPMLYVPRHFFVNNHMGIEEVLGADKYAEILYKAGYKSAWHWCEKEAECHGLEGVAVELHTWLDAGGELVVEQRLSNRLPRPVAFNCDLYAPNRRRARVMVRELSDGECVDQFRLPDGEQLLGATLWLQAEEIDGPHVLSYRFEARP